MVGGSIVRKLRHLSFNNILLRTREELDLSNQLDVSYFFSNHDIDYVIMAAGKVGGVRDNDHYSADYLYENAIMAMNVIHSSFKSNVKKLLYLGSTCIYPKDALEPIQEKELLNGYLEQTNRSYAIAKISGIEFCRSIYKQYGREFISAMPTNVFGPGDNFDLNRSHVIPALIRKVHEAKEFGKNYITIWGTGRPLRNFIYVDDLAEALLLVLDKYSEIDPINIGSDIRLSITDLALIICEALGHKVNLRYDTSKPDGTFSKDISLEKISHLNFTPKIDLITGIQKTYQWALENKML